MSPSPLTLSSSPLARDLLPGDLRIQSLWAAGSLSLVRDPGMSLRDIGVPRELVSSSAPIASRNLWPHDRTLTSISGKEPDDVLTGGGILLSPVGVLFQESTPPWTTTRFPSSFIAKSGGLAPEPVQNNGAVVASPAAAKLLTRDPEERALNNLENETNPHDELTYDALTYVGTDCKDVDAVMPAFVFTSNEARSDEQIAQVDEAMQARNSEIFSETPVECA